MIKHEPKKPKCKTKKGLDTNGIGYDAEVLVKKKLWTFGYKVRHIAFGYDLLVNEKIRVEVKTGKMRQAKKGAYWNIMTPTHQDYDILAIVLTHPIRNLILFYTKKVVDEQLKRHKNQYGVIVSKENGRIDLGEKSPYKVFGKPRAVKELTK